MRSIVLHCYAGIFLSRFKESDFLSKGEVGHQKKRNIWIKTCFFTPVCSRDSQCVTNCLRRRHEVFRLNSDFCRFL